MTKGIIFDLDGTLLDTLPDIHFTLNATLEKFSAKPVTYLQTKSFIGNGARSLVERALPPDLLPRIDEILADYSLRYGNCNNNLTRCFDGAEEFLSCANENGVKLAIITNKPQNALDNTLKKFFRKVKFVAAIGQSSKYSLKPNPTSTEEVLKLMKINHNECVFVGDGETDVQTAANANVGSVSALWGYRTREQLEKAGAKLFACSFDELKRMIL